MSSCRAAGSENEIVMESWDAEREGERELVIIGCN